MGPCQTHRKTFKIAKHQNPEPSSPLRWTQKSVTFPHIFPINHSQMSNWSHALNIYFPCKSFRILNRTEVLNSWCGGLVDVSWRKKRLKMYHLLQNPCLKIHLHPYISEGTWVPQLHTPWFSL
jgi:hypothetical protein